MDGPLEQVQRFATLIGGNFFLFVAAPKESPTVMLYGLGLFPSLKTGLSVALTLSSLGQKEMEYKGFNLLCAYYPTLIIFLIIWSSMSMSLELYFWPPDECKGVGVINQHC